MKIEYIFFFMFFIPLVNSALKYILKLNVRKNSEDKKKQWSSEKITLMGGIYMIASSAPYVGAYFYADLKYIWILIAGVYLFLGIINLLIGWLVVVGDRYKNEPVIEKRNEAKEKYKNVEFWPGWHTKMQCGYQIVLFVLWMYSWRSLFVSG